MGWISGVTPSLYQARMLVSYVEAGDASRTFVCPVWLRCTSPPLNGEGRTMRMVANAPGAFVVLGDVIREGA